MADELKFEEGGDLKSESNALQQFKETAEKGIIGLDSYT